MSADPSTEWAHRLQGRASDALDRLVTTLLDAQQVLTAVPTIAPQQLSEELSRYWQAQLPDTYQQLADGGVRYLSRMAMVSADYGTQWLREALPGHRLAMVGPPPPVPAVPTAADPMEWVGWYVRGAAWSAQQQAWVGQALAALREEIAAGSVGDREIQMSAQRFLEQRLPDYLSDIADVGMDLVADGLAVADGSVQSLATTVLGHPPTSELTVEVAGPAGTVASVDLAIENNRDQPADVHCRVTPAGADLTVEPDQFHLAAGATRRVTLRVALPEAPSDEPVIAGRVQVSGSGDAPLSVRVRATVLAPRRPITVRALGPVPGARPGSADAPGDPE